MSIRFLLLHMGIYILSKQPPQEIRQKPTKSINYSGSNNLHSRLRTQQTMRIIDHSKVVDE